MKELDYIWKLWENYKNNTPTAALVQDILHFKKDEYFNDHIAFRTVKIPGLEKEKIASVFEKMGWSVTAAYHFNEKKLDAIHLENQNNSRLPKIFISELLVDEFSESTQKIIQSVFLAYPKLPMNQLLLKGRQHSVNLKDYEVLATESEYASWMYIYGFQANHFTVYINNYPELSIEKFIAQLKEKNIPLNQSGGIIKGSQDIGLKQASTLADVQQIFFENEKINKNIPSCYVEFAQRFEKNGTLFQGFITSSADKIFESTNLR